MVRYSLYFIVVLRGLTQKVISLKSWAREEVSLSSYRPWLKSRYKLQCQPLVTALVHHDIMTHHFFNLLGANWHSRHDSFNIISLPLICTLNILFLSTEAHILFQLQFFSFLFYLLIDTIWVVLRPESVASPSTITMHHLICLWAWMYPYIYAPELSKWISAMLVVEINTFLLIAKRVWPGQKLISYLFYITWFAIRVVYYPYMLYLFIYEFVGYSSRAGSYLNRSLVLLLAGILLNCLNAKWTYDLLTKKRLRVANRVDTNVSLHVNLHSRVEGL